VRKVLVAALCAAIFLPTTSCGSPKLTGTSSTKTVALGPVTQVHINYGTLRIRQGTPSSLTIRADKSVMRYVVARHKGSALDLGVPDDADIRSYVLPPMPKDAPVEFVLTTDSLKAIDMGDGAVLVDGYTAPTLTLNANLGRADIAGINVNEWRCTMNGGVTDVVVSGVAKLPSSSNSSGSHYDDSGLRLK
jgi:hypothetical protein